MELNQNKIDILVRKAEELFAKKAYGNAVAILREALKQYPDSAQIHSKLGVMLMYSPSQEQALVHLKQAVSLDTYTAEYHIALVNFYIRKKAWKSALDILQNAISALGQEKQLLWILSQVYEQLGDLNKALHIIQNLHQSDPKNIQFLNALGILLKKLQREEKALEIYQHILKNYAREQIGDHIIGNWIDLMIKNKRSNEAHETLEYLLTFHPNDVILLCHYAVTGVETNHDITHALSLLEKAWKLDPKNNLVNYNLGVYYLQVGDTDRSFKHFELANSLDTKTLFNMGIMHTYTYGDKFFKRLNQTAATFSNLSTEQKTYLHYGLAKAYEDVDALKTAFEHYKVGGLLHAGSKGLESYNYLKQMTRLFQDKIDHNFFLNIHEQREESNKPVFIVGMPRSGTTLLEQILSGFEGVHGAGELIFAREAINYLDINGQTITFPESTAFSSNYKEISLKERGAYYLKKVEALIGKNSLRIIDKMPHNFIWLGLLHLILPNASIIHMRRHPVETCLSAYRLPFANGHYWSDNLEIMGKYYRLYAELMAYWKKVLPEGTMLDVRYEDIVNHPEKESKRIAEYLGVEWRAECLEFHEKKNTVRTASATQVRKPIYKDSINRWHKYEPYLQPLLNEIKDIVDTYEAEL